MIVQTFTLEKQTKGFTDIVNITPDITTLIKESKISDGLATVFVPGSTGSITTVEYEPGLLEDLPEFFEKIIPQTITYKHDRTWSDGNGYAHLRASLLGPSLSVPVTENKMTLGTWQQIIFIDFDNRPRKRNLIVQIMGS